MSRYEANLQGGVEAGIIYTGFSEVEELKKIFSKLGWTPKETFKGTGGYYRFNISINSQDIRLHIYLKKLTFGGREGRPSEKRAQFSATIDRTGFDITQSTDELALILAIYKRDIFSDTIICAWDIKDWGYNVGRAFNCFVDIQSVSYALINGFAQHKTANDQIVCCFRPDWFFYYLKNKNKLHEQIIPSEILKKRDNILLNESNLWDFVSKGNRKPQLDIPYQYIHLDVRNPRLAPYLIGINNPSPIDLLSIIYENFDTEVVALSMAANGYFDEEPIIVVPSKIPDNFKFSDYGDVNSLTEKLEQLIRDGEIEFTVVEGNRRISTINLLLDNHIRSQINVNPDYPNIGRIDIRQDLSMVPCIIYEHRDDVSAYLGVRHIAGLLKWEAYAKAAYVAGVVDDQHKKGESFQNAIEKAQQVYGDRSDSLKKQYITYKMYLEAKNDLHFNVKSILDKFSLLIVLYNSPAIRDYLGVSNHNKIDFDQRIVPTEKYAEFRNVLTWIYGDEDKGIKPVLTDSRKITNSLSFIVQKEEAVTFLNKYQDLEGAFDRTNGERDYLSKNITRAFRALQASLSFAYKYKGDEDLLKQIAELEDLISALKQNLQK